MAKNPGQTGADAVWGGPHQPSNLKKGNPKYGMDPMQVLKAPLKYSPGPISSKAKANQGGNWPSSMNAEGYDNPTV